MSKAYPSNLTLTQYEFLSDMIPEPKPGGRKRENLGSRAHFRVADGVSAVGQRL